MHALIDADILRYEVGFASEVGWKNGDLPPFEYVEEMLHNRLDRIVHGAGATSSTLFLSEGPTFREAIATVKPYKGTRRHVKPWHFNNLTVYMRDVLGAEIVVAIEADDAMSVRQCTAIWNRSIYHENSGNKVDETIICTRDKDLRQVPGWHYGWEMGAQPEFGPMLVTKEGGGLSLNKKRSEIKGTGLPFFYAQVLQGDTADNIPGLPGCGAVRTHDLLEDCTLGAMLDMVKNEYEREYGSEWEEWLLEQGQLCWMSRRLNPDGSAVLWQIGMEE